MFYVTSLIGSQVEPLINIGTDFKWEQSTDGTFTVSFTTYNNSGIAEQLGANFLGVINPGYDLLTSEAVVTIDDYDFKVKQFHFSAYGKTITATSTFFELAKKQVYAELKGTQTLQNRLNLALNGSNWTFTVDSSIANKSVLINDFGRDNRIALINKICKYYECEYLIGPNNTVHFAAQIGPDNDFQYRYKHNISSVVLKEDSTNLYTKIVGYGANGLTVTYTSPNATVYGALEAKPIEDDRFTIASNLLDYLKQQITDVPELAIETTLADLTNRAIGEHVWLIYEPIGIEMKTRILKQTKILAGGKLITASVIFGNSLVTSSADLYADQQQAYKDLDTVAVKQEQNYGGAELSDENGLVVRAGDVETTANATVGFRIKKGNIVKFLVDALGQLLLDGRLKITNGNGVTTLLEAYLDTLGGRLIINDQYGNLNVKLGSEEVSNGVQGGMMKIYKDHDTQNARVELGIFKDFSLSEGSGVVKLRDGNGRVRVSMYSFNDDYYGAALNFYNSNGDNVTSYAQTYARIAGQFVATQDWVQAQDYASTWYVDQAIANALENYTPPE